MILNCKFWNVTLLKFAHGKNGLQMYHRFLQEVRLNMERKRHWLLPDYVRWAQCFPL